MKPCAYQYQFVFDMSPSKIAEGLRRQLSWGISPRFIRKVLFTQGSIISALSPHRRTNVSILGVWCVAGSRRAGHWDEVIEEAAGELEGVEGQLHTASRQLLDLRSATAQLSADAQQASAAKQQARPKSLSSPFLTARL